MKYPKWREYPTSKKWRAVADEVELETHNGTTKDDLLNMVKFLAGEAVRLQARVYDLEGSTGFHYCEDCGCYGGEKGCRQFDMSVNPEHDGCTFWTDRGEGDADE